MLVDYSEGWKFHFQEILPMGSTAPVDKLKKKKKTVITLKKLLSEVAEPGVKMGNLCSLGAAAKKVMGNRTLCYIMSCLRLHYFSISIWQSIDFIEPFANVF